MVRSLLAILFVVLLSSEIFAVADNTQTIPDSTVLIEEIPDTAKGYRTFKAVTFFDATVSSIYNVLTDYAAYPEFMPNVEKIDIQSETGSVTTINYHLGLPFGKKKRYRLAMSAVLKTTSIHGPASKSRIEWNMLPWPELKESETIVDTVGYWSLTPQGEGTRVEYYVRTHPGNVPFGLGWIVDILTSKSIPDVIEKTRERVREQLIL